MAMPKGISISLAAKCQLLFGLAVLVIIAGALAVPWQRMEQLAVQPNVKAARLAADMFFREVHAGAASPTSTQPAEWNDITLNSDANYSRPRIFTATSAAAEFAKDTEAGNDV